MLPDIEAEARAAVSRPKPDFAGGENVQLGFSAAYEVDLWGRIRASISIWGENRFLRYTLKDRKLRSAAWPSVFDCPVLQFLAGVVVNDSVIMIYYANHVREDQSPYNAIHEAGLRRFRPIVLTTLTTFGGLTPIIMETSSQAEYLIPMAISLGFGIIFATSIILVIVPCL